MSMIERIRSAVQGLVKDVNGPFESGSELVGIIELSNGQAAQFHLTLTRDEYAFIDPDGPTGCADDLMVTLNEFK
jgi:hypothetical protein